jgi:hypothetical protein
VKEGKFPDQLTISLSKILLLEVKFLGFSDDISTAQVMGE